MWNSSPPDGDLPAVLEPQELEIGIGGNGASDRQQRQRDEAALQELVKRKTKEIKLHVNSEDRV